VERKRTRQREPSRKISCRVARQQRELEEQRAYDPHFRAAAKHWKQLLRKVWLEHEDEEGVEEEDRGYGKSQGPVAVHAHLMSRRVR
jgi:hypothetical protein